MQLYCAFWVWRLKQFSDLIYFAVFTLGICIVVVDSIFIVLILYLFYVFKDTLECFGRGTCSSASFLYRLVFSIFGYDDKLLKKKGVQKISRNNKVTTVPGCLYNARVYMSQCSAYITYNDLSLIFLLFFFTHNFSYFFTHFSL